MKSLPGTTTGRPSSHSTPQRRENAAERSADVASRSRYTTDLAVVERIFTTHSRHSLTSPIKGGFQATTDISTPRLSDVDQSVQEKRECGTGKNPNLCMYTTAPLRSFIHARQCQNALIRSIPEDRPSLNRLSLARDWLRRGNGELIRHCGCSLLLEVAQDVTRWAVIFGPQLPDRRKCDRSGGCGRD
jgi:hypothetical protein